jgi:hypothetical protein
MVLNFLFTKVSKAKFYEVMENCKSSSCHIAQRTALVRMSTFTSCHTASQVVTFLIGCCYIAVFFHRS